MRAKFQVRKSSGQLADYEWQQLDYKLRDLLDAPLYVDDTPSLSVFELRTKARRLVREHGVRLLLSTTCS